MNTEITKYPKINTIYKRDERGKLIIGDYSIPEFKYLEKNMWQATEKINGTNIRLVFKRVVYNNSSHIETSILGRAEDSIVPKPLERKLEQIIKDINIQKIFDKMKDGDTIIIFGEGYGNKIQDIGSGYIKDDIDFIIFDVLHNKYWYPYSEVLKLGSELGLKVVPYLGEFTLSDAIKVVTTGFKSLIAENQTLIAEGMVLRPSVPLYDSSGNKITMKLKYKDFQKF